MIEIEKGVPIPPIGNHGNGRVAKYPFGEMDVGDSFYCHPNVNTKKAAKALRGSIYNAAQRRKGMEKAKFTCRSMIIEELFTIRCWRIK